MALDGQAPRAAFASVGKESLFRQVTSPGWQPTDDNVSKALEALLELMPDAPNAPPIAVLLRQAVGHDSGARATLEGMNLWQTLRLSLSRREVTWFSVVVDHGAEVEWASREADSLARERRFDQLAATVHAHPTLSQYLTSAAIAALGASTPDPAKQLACAAGACEFLLAQVARVDADPSADLGPNPGHRFLELSTAEANRRCIPGRGFVEWMKRRYGARSLAALWDMAPADASGRRPVAYNALQSWQSGVTAPNRKKAEDFVGAIARHVGLQGSELQEEWRLFDLQRWGACRVDATLRLVNYLAAIPPSPGVPGIFDLLEAEGADHWCRRQYGRWLDRWRQQAADQAKA
jgi:hypothetical protein